MDPSTALEGGIERRAPIDLESPSYIRRGRRAGDLPLDAPAERAPAAPEPTDESTPAPAGALSMAKPS